MPQYVLAYRVAAREPLLADVAFLFTDLNARRKAGKGGLHRLCHESLHAQDRHARRDGYLVAAGEPRPPVHLVSVIRVSDHGKAQTQARLGELNGLLTLGAHAVAKVAGRAQAGRPDWRCGKGKRFNKGLDLARGVV